MGDTVDARTISFVGRQLALIGDEINRHYTTIDDMELAEIEALLEARRMRRRKSLRRIATIILQGGGFNVGVYAAIHFWMGYRT